MENNGMSYELDEEDPVIHEIPVFLAKGLNDTLHILQYPLRPAQHPYKGSTVCQTKIRPSSNQLEVTVSLETKGQNFSQSRGMQYAQSDGGGAYFTRGVMDKQVLSSKPHKIKDTSHYAAGVYKDNQIHLTLIKDIIELRPCLRHLELIDDTPSRTNPPTSDGDTTATESEGEEPKPITVKFARSNTKDKKTAATVTEEEPWKPLHYNSLESDQAANERALLFAGDDVQLNVFSTNSEYLDMICPIETVQKSESPLGPTDVLSLTNLKKLPKEKQVVELMKKSVVLTFDKVCTLLGRGKADRASVLADLQKCSLLVQGCWVLCSALLLTKDNASLRNARDYILWCFTKQRVLTRKDIVPTQINSQQINLILGPIANTRQEGGWQFKIETDVEFISKYPQVVTDQNAFWHRRHLELIHIHGIGTPPDSKGGGANVSTVSSTGGGQEIKSEASVSKEIKIEAGTPFRPHPLEPTQILERHGISNELFNSLKQFCQETLGRGVVSLTELNDRLLIRQSSLSENDPLREHGISNELLCSAVKMIGGIELGQTHSKRLFTIINIGDQTDRYRSAIINILKTAKSLRRKQVVEMVTDCDNKLLTSTLRDLCYTKGALWYLKGT